MASTSRQPENELTNALEQDVFPPELPSSSSPPPELPSCFPWFSSLFCCLQFNPISWQSTSGRSTMPVKKPEVEVIHAFEEVATSASTSGISTMPVEKPEVEVIHAFEEVVTSASTSGRSPMPVKKLPYDVFINHRGPDVKHTLATTFYNTFTSMGLRVFLDSEELELGDFLPAELEAAMKSASLHIAIFSEKYAESPWCLAELSYMLKTGTQIVPVFYHVEPADVRYAKGVYAEAFSHHKEKRRYSSKKLQEWKDALYSVSYNIGHIINNKEDEGRLLKNIVNCVLRVIKNVPLVVAKHPVGLDEVVRDFERIRLQSAESHPTVQIVGIWGMGGCGKTTLAKQLYNIKYKNMQRSSFLVDVRDCASKNLLHNKQKKLLEDLGLNLSVDNIEEGKGILASRLRSVQVLIVLDDVDKVDQLDALVPEKDSLGCGSLIVVTTRELEVLRCWGISSIYKMKALDSAHAKQLFCWHAFLQPSPLSEYEDLIENFLNVCNGLPLSLKVFGGQLYGISNQDYWRSLLHKISRILDKDIKEKLKVSYDTLDDEEKQMFLDSACCFIGEKKTWAIATWDGSGWSGLYGWERLLNKCLVELDDQDCIRMHDHLRDLGREIANQKSPYRLWYPEQIINVDNEAQRIGIRGIMTTTAGSRSEVEFPRCSQGGEVIVNTSRGDCSLTPNSLGLEFLQITGNNYNQVIGDKSRDLVWLRWFYPGQRNLQSLSSLKNLRVLELCERGCYADQLEELWETDSDGPVQLRQLIISRCSNFQGFPNSIGCLRHLKSIVLSGCGEFLNKISSLPESFCFLQSLEHLSLPGCVELSSLPSSFGDLRNLRHLDLSYCEELRSLPNSFKKLTLLQHLCLEGCSNLALESDILENMTKVEYLNLRWCLQLEELPRHITNQASLRELDLEYTSIREIPPNISQLSKLQKFSVGSESLTSLPTSLVDLSSLATLTIEICPNLESLPTSLGDLSSLTALRINGFSKLEFLPDSVGRLNLLEDLYIGASGLKSLPKSFSQTQVMVDSPISGLDLRAGLFTSSLCNLKRIYLVETQVSKISISEDCCPSLDTLHLLVNEHLIDIEVLPTTVKQLLVENCGMLRNISGIVGLVNIKKLWIIGCPDLDALPSFAQLASLQVFKLRGCYGVEKIQGLEHCRALVELTADTRWEEAGTESLELMERLRVLQLTAISRSAVEGCIPSMQKWREEIIVCTRAVPKSGSLLDSSTFTNLSVIHSISNQTFNSDSNPTLKLSSTAHCILLCFVVNCDSPQFELWIEGEISSEISGDTLLKVEEGKWVLICVFTQRSSWHTSEEFRIKPRHSEGEGEVDGEVERGMVVVGEEERVVEAFQGLWALLSN